MRAVRTLLLLAAVLALAAGGALAAGPASAAADRVDRVLVIGVPGLLWSDVDPAATPEMADLADGGAIGALSVRAARARTCILDGWASLGAGNRAAWPEPDATVAPDAPDAGAVDAGAPDAGALPAPRCRDQERLARAGLPDPLAMAAQVAADDATARFGAEPGALAAAVGCATVVGGGAALAAAAPGVSLSTADAVPAERSGVSALLSGCPLTLVSLDGLVGARAGGRPGALAAVDDAVGRLRAAAAALPGRTLLLLAGVSDVGKGEPRLHVAVAAGPGFERAAWLSSPSTGRAPFVQLIDVAPTALQALGIGVPPGMNGRPMADAGDRLPLRQTVGELRSADVAAVVHYRSTGPFFWLLVGLDAALVAAGLVVLGARAARRDPPGRARAVVRTGALGLAVLPAATYLAGLVPWERLPHPVVALAAAVAAAGLLLLAVVALGPWRRHPLGPALAVVALTAGTLLADVVTGSHLELDGLLGYDPIVAGRFTGLGNLGSALLSTSALLGTAALAEVLGRRSRRPRAVRLAVVLGAGGVLVAVIGAPGLGRDFGGVLATLPGFLLLAMLLAGIRVTVLRLAAALGAGVVAVAAVAFLDWLRPAAERTHLGRFVDQLRTGEAWTVVGRKASANWGILLHSPLAWELAIAGVAAWWLVRRGGLLRGGGGAGMGPGDRAVLRAGLLACAFTLLLGAAVNDSGVAVPAAAAALLVPLLVQLAAGPRSAGDAPGIAAGTAVSGPGGGPGGVTVGSRGSTDWNT